MKTPPKVARFDHWPEYLIEGLGLGLFMLSASAFAILLEHPSSPLRHALREPLTRRVLMGFAMGLTAIALIYSPWGRRSGAHFNPAVTFTFFRLGKVASRDAFFYPIAHFAGGALGMIVAAHVFGSALADTSVRYVATQPGVHGAAAAFVAEFVIAAVLMTVVLNVSNTPRLARFTGLCAGACVALFITFEAPISGMSLNPARTFASAWVARDATALWIYFTAPPLGMLAAAAFHQHRPGASRVICAKLHHSADHRCIFCEYHRSPTPAAEQTLSATM